MGISKNPTSACHFPFWGNRKGAFKTKCWVFRDALYVTASSFPKGITEAHDQLHQLVPFSTGRKYFGLSQPENGTIVYRAAAEEMHAGEAGKLKCDTLVLKKGRYACLTINNYVKDITSIEKAFHTLLSLPGLDPQGYCVEWYLNEKDVKCMIRFNQ